MPIPVMDSFLEQDTFPCAVSSHEDYEVEHLWEPIIGEDRHPAFVEKEGPEQAREILTRIKEESGWGIIPSWIMSKHFGIYSEVFGVLALPEEEKAEPDSAYHESMGIDTSLIDPTISTSCPLDKAGISFKEHSTQSRRVYGGSDPVVKRHAASVLKQLLAQGEYARIPLWIALDHHDLVKEIMGRLCIRHESHEEETPGCHIFDFPEGPEQLFESLMRSKNEE
jgi:hypothetical protein